MKPVNDIEEFLARPLGHYVVSSTFVAWCAAPDLVGSVHRGRIDEQSALEMLAVLNLVGHHDLAPTGRVFMDCREVEHIDVDVLVQFLELARSQLVVWSARVERHAVLVPGGIVGILIAGAMTSLFPTHPLQLDADLDAALAFLAHPAAQAAHATATAVAGLSRGESMIIRRLRSHLARDLVGARVKEVAEALGLSVRTLQRELYLANLSFRDVYRKARIAAAEEQLAHSDLKVEDIAERVGFGTASRMNAALRREHSLTASQVRARGRQ